MGNLLEKSNKLNKQLKRNVGLSEKRKHNLQILKETSQLLDESEHKLENETRKLETEDFIRKYYKWFIIIAVIVIGVMVTPLGILFDWFKEKDTEKKIDKKLSSHLNDNLLIEN
jgi:uncharacterized membrane protein YjjP (DUF1212 family)